MTTRSGQRSDLWMAPVPRRRRWTLAVRRTLLAMLVVGSVGAVQPLQAQFPLLRRASTLAQLDSVAQARARVSPESPRASVTTFLELAKAHDYEGASQYLELSAAQRVRGAELARRLRDVLDQRLWIAMDQVSPLTVGDTTDGSVDFDRLGVVPGVTGLPEAVMLRRFSGDQITRWQFDQQTVRNIDGWWADLPDAWLRGRIPEPLLAEGPFSVYYWQWLGMLAAIVASVVFATLFALALRSLLALVTARSASEWDDMLVSRVRGPFRLWLVGMLSTPLFGMLGLNARIAGLASDTSRGIVLAAFFWAALRVISMVQDRLLLGPWAAGQPQARTLVPLLTRFLRVSVVLFALLVVLSQFGYPVGTLLAGLGLGGVALALASQKTIEHMFGSVSLAADKAFRVGDMVRVGTIEGTVERIGLRSTSLRTLGRTVVRIPNGKLAEEPIETFGERDRFLLQHDLGVTYGTTPAKIRRIVERIEALLHAQPGVWTESLFVRTVGFADSAITLRVRAWFELPDYVTFLDMQHEVLLACMEIIQEEGSSFAFPSRTIYNVNQTETRAPQGAPLGAPQGAPQDAPPSRPEMPK